MSDDKANPNPRIGIAHDFACTHDPCVCEYSKGPQFLFFKFVHNALVHPLLSLPWEPRWAQCVHDWTAARCLGAG